MRRTRRRGRSRALSWAGLVLVAAVQSGCTGSVGQEAPAPTPSASPRSLRLHASVAQFRFDEGTHNLKAGVTNSGRSDIRVDRATIVWPGFAFPTVELPDDPVPPGETAAFTIAYGAPRCAPLVGAEPVLVADVDGRTRRLPLHVDEPGLLGRLRVKACGQQHLDAVARVHLRLATRTVHKAGEEYLPGVIVLRRRAAGGALHIVDLGGSVLIDLVPRDGPRALPATLPSGRPLLRFPVLFGSAHRCDAHALGQSSQTFLLSAYVRVPGLAIQRELLGLDDADRSRLFGVVHRDCR